MKKFDKYKDSGIEWIGEIPEHWEVKRLKRFAKIGNGQDHKKVWDDNGEYPIIGTGGVFGKANKYLHKGPSVILGRKGTIDKPQFIESPFWSVDTAYYTEINQDVNPKLFYYLCTTINFELYKYGSAVPSMTQEVLSQIPFVVSDSLEEQTAIATYLDRKTAEIDELIADKKRLLELYEEEKTAIINQAVTKGINPDVPMKDSGIEWLGEIPEHWEVSKLARTVEKITNGYVGPVREVMQDSGIPYIQGIHIKNNTIRFTPNGKYYVSKTWSESHSKSILATGDILVVQTGSIGDVGIVPKEFEGANCHALLILRVKSELYEPEYLLKLLASELGYNSLQLIKTGEILYHINGSKLKGIDVLIPPKNEQQSIVRHIETECKRIDTQVERTQKLIELLEEYREALISEVVTGKIKVI